MPARKFFSVLLILLIFQIFACRQENYEEKFPYFQGEVEYAYTYESEVLDVDSLNENKPHTGVFRYDLDNYKSTFFSQIDTLSYYYLSETNSALAQDNAQIVRECENYGIPTDSIIYFNVYETNEEVMRHSCKVIEYKSKQLWNQYFVSKEIKVSPNTYKDHFAYNMEFYGRESDGGLILKLEHRFKKYTMKGIATRIRIFYKSESALELSAEKIKKLCQQFVEG